MMKDKTIKQLHKKIKTFVQSHLNILYWLMFIVTPLAILLVVFVLTSIIVVPISWVLGYI